MNRSDVETYIHSEFAAITQDYPWDDMPDATVFRHSDTRKWFALIMRVKSSTLGLPSADFIDILNLKCDPDLLETLITSTPGLLPAYHMNKRHWLTILLSQTVPPDVITNLIDLSFRLTSKNPHA